jgi:hypothetical protein
MFLQLDKYNCVYVTQLYLSNCRNMKIIVNHLHIQLYLSNCRNMKIIVNHLHIHSYICLTVET